MVNETNRYQKQALSNLKLCPGSINQLILVIALSLSIRPPTYHVSDQHEYINKCGENPSTFQRPINQPNRDGSELR